MPPVEVIRVRRRHDASGSDARRSSELHAWHVTPRRISMDEPEPVLQPPLRDKKRKIIALDDPPESPNELNVMSHAARRKEKRLRNLTTSPNVAVQVTSPEINHDLEPARLPRKNSVWVGNLAFKTTPDSLRKFFDGVGEITRLHMPMKKQVAVDRGLRGDNMGFAYVDFATADAKTIAITLSEGNLDGRRLLIKDGADFTGRPSTTLAGQAQGEGSSQPSGTVPNNKSAQKILKAQKQPSASTLFMGNLPFQATEESIRGMLESHRISRKRSKKSSEQLGEAEETGMQWLRKIRLGTFEDSGKCKGWAFLDFVTVAQATEVLTDKRNHRLDGRELVLEYASPEAARRGEKTSRSSKRVPFQENFHAPKSAKPSINGSDRNPKQGEDRKKVYRHGTALALTKPEKVAITPSEGKKIKFE